MPSPARTDESAEVVTGALKIPPHSIEAEQAVLGGLMLDNEAWAAVAERVGEADFYRHDHRLIFRAIGALAEAAKPCDVVTVAEWLEHAGELDKAGGLPFIAALAEQTPPPPTSSPTPTSSVPARCCASSSAPAAASPTWPSVRRAAPTMNCWTRPSGWSSRSPSSMPAAAPAICPSSNC